MHGRLRSARSPPLTRLVNVNASSLSGAVTLTGSSAANAITGGGGNDTIDGAGGADTIDGGGGNDSITYRGVETSIDGGSGTDTLTFSATGSTTAINLGVAAGADQTTGDAVTIANFENVNAGIFSTALTVTAFTLDAALGAVMQPGSLLNSRPIFGLRWYGFGNVTFAAYATAGLFLAGYVAHRCLVANRRAAAVAAVGAIGFGIVLCEGWPTMGSDFGGVIALTPAVLWLMLALSDVKITWPKLLVIAGAALLLVAAISVLDWLRGPDQRSHLGNFVQRVLDGDALDVISRKAVASAESIASPLGIGSLLIGVVLWIVIFRYVVPRISSDFTTARSTLIAALVVAILGTLLNDGGISVWLTATAEVTVVVGWFFLDWAERNDWTPRTAMPERR